MALFSIPKIKKPVRASKKVASDTSKKSAKQEQPNQAPSKKMNASSSSFSQGREHVIIVSPHFSEKATRLQEDKKYIFNVIPSAGKGEIKKAIETIYKVTVVKINVLKSFTRSKKWIAKKTNFMKQKRAVVTIKKDQKIELGI